MLKPSIQLRIGQQLAMTPQLQQAIRLLQLSTLELQAEIQQNFETNPMLETQEEDTEPTENGTGNSDNTAEENSKQEPSDIDAGGDSENMSDELPVDSNWEDTYDMSASYSSGSDGPEQDIFENQSGNGESLQDQLLWQMHMMSLSDTDRAIATAIIDSVDEAGYLTDSLESIHANLAADQLNETDIELDEVEAILHLIQQFDPVGCASRNLSECLSIQLRKLPADTPRLNEAKKLVLDHLDLLAARNFKQIMRQLNLKEDALQETVDLVQSLNPRPGSQLSNRAPEYIVPDVSVFKQEGKWRVELNPDTAPKLRINSLYAGLIKRADTSQDNTYMRNQLQEARWFIKSLQSRNETLLKVATSIVEHQRRFLEYGDEAMKPLVLRDIAEQLEMHESTISRVTTHKYMHTPRGIYEFKYFFSSHVGTADGGVCSATAIRSMIKKLVSEENKAKPLSDNKIAAILEDKGINVARRTVAKYREAMNIPPSNERKRIN